MEWLALLDEPHPLEPKLFNHLTVDPVTHMDAVAIALGGLCVLNGSVVLVCVKRSDDGLVELFIMNEDVQHV